MSYTVKAGLVYSNGEGIESEDINEMQGIQDISFADFFLLPQFNFNPDAYGYAYQDIQSDFSAYTEGCQPVARVSSVDGYTVTNNAGTIYLLTNDTTFYVQNDPNPDGYKPNCVYVVNLTPDALALDGSNFPADATHPRYFTISLHVSNGVENVNRDFQDQSTGVVTSLSTPKYNELTITPIVTAGTPASSPTIPTFTGLPWAVIYVPANSGPFVDGTNVFPVSIPRGINKYVVGPFDGSSTSAVGDAKTMFIPGINFSTDIATSASGTNGWGITSGYLSNQGTSGPAVIGLELPSTATLEALTLYYYKGALGSTTAITSSIDAYGTVSPLAGGGGALTSTDGNLRNKFTLETPISTDAMTGLIFTYTQSTAAGNERIYGLELNYTDSPSKYAGFMARFPSNKLVALGTSTSYAVQIPIHGAAKKLEKIKCLASVVSGQFSLGYSAGSGGAITSLLNSTQLNTFLDTDGKTFDFLISGHSARLDSYWLNGALSPFAKTNTGYLYLVWTPTTIGNEFYGAEFVVAG